MEQADREDTQLAGGHMSSEGGQSVDDLPIQVGGG